MGDTRFYPDCANYLPALGRFLEQKYEQEGYDVQLLEEQRGGRPRFTFQMRPRYRESWIKKVSTFAGLDTAATVVMKTAGEDLEIEFGGAKWLDKAAVAGVGILASVGVLLVPAAIGAYKQRELLKTLQKAVDDFFRLRDG